jgi:hypothetical protein
MIDYLHCQVNQHKAQPSISGQCGYYDEPLRFGAVWSELGVRYLHGAMSVPNGSLRGMFFFNVAESLPSGPKCKACCKDVEEANRARKIASVGLLGQTNVFWQFWTIALGQSTVKNSGSFQLVF